MSELPVVVVPEEPWDDGENPAEPKEVENHVFDQVEQPPAEVEQMQKTEDKVLDKEEEVETR